MAGGKEKVQVVWTRPILPYILILVATKPPTWDYCSEISTNYCITNYCIWSIAHYFKVGGGITCGRSIYGKAQSVAYISSSTNTSVNEVDMKALNSDTSSNE